MPLPKQNHQWAPSPNGPWSNKKFRRRENVVRNQPTCYAPANGDDDNHNPTSVVDLFNHRDWQYHNQLLSLCQTNTMESPIYSPPSIIGANNIPFWYWLLSVVRNKWITTTIGRIIHVNKTYVSAKSIRLLLLSLFSVWSDSSFVALLWPMFASYQFINDLNGSVRFINASTGLLEDKDHIILQWMELQQFHNVYTTAPFINIESPTHRHWVHGLK